MNMSNYNKKRPLIALIVPTGIGASIGGYAGDASQTAQMFAKNFNVIVNPNVVNAACFSGITENMLYTEGWAFTQFMKGNLNLIPSQNNKIGIIFDKGISQGILNVHINTINAVKTVYGINVIGYEITKEPCEIEFYNTESGISSGRVSNEKTLIEAGKNLIRKGAEVIAVVCKFDEPPEDNYKYGDEVDIVGGVEAIISHFLTKELKVPVVHAPAFEDITITKDLVDKKVAAEYITPTFLPCLLIALKNSPLYSYNNRALYSICRKNLQAVIMPYNSLGSSIVLDAIKAKIPVYAVKENSTVLNVTKDKIKKIDIIETETYIECLNKIKGKY